MDPVEQSFLSRIIESPEDDSLRLMYADWLDEQNSLHGEFIRLQLQREAFDSWDPEFLELTARSERLHALHGNEWVTECPGTHEFTNWRRGFPLTLRTDPGTWIRHGTGLSQLPFELLDMTIGCTVAGMASLNAPATCHSLRLPFEWVEPHSLAFYESPLFQQLDGLWYTSWDIMLDARELETLSQSPGRALTSLGLPMIQTDERQFRSSMDGPRFGEIQELCLSHARLSGDETEWIATGPWMKSLERLAVGDSIYGWRLLNAAPPDLRMLDCGGLVPASEHLSLFSSFECLTSIQSLAAQSGLLNGLHWFAPPMERLRELMLRDAPEVIAEVVNAGALSGLRRLQFSGRQTRAVIHELAKCSLMEQLTSLALLQISPVSAVKELFATGRMTQLRQLTLECPWEQLEDISILNPNQLPRLVWLTLGSCRPTDSFIEQFLDSALFHQLTALTFRNCQLSNRALELLQEHPWIQLATVDPYGSLDDEDDVENDPW